MIKLILIDAGHGLSNGKPDPGAVGSGTTERKEVKEIAQETVDLLQLQQLKGVEVLSIGLLENLDLLTHIQRANAEINARDLKPEQVLLVSIHINSGGGNRVESWYKGDDEVSEAAAALVLEAVAAESGIPKGKVLPDTQNRHGRLGILRDVEATTVLIECGFIDTPSNAAVLIDAKKDDAFSTGIVKAICQLQGVPFTAGGTVFPDVEPGRWSEQAIKFCKEKGLMKGYSDGLFRPTAPVSREELAVVLDRMYEAVLESIERAIDVD